MKKTIFQHLLLLFILPFLTTCGFIAEISTPCGNCASPVEASITLTDVKGKVLKNQTVLVSGYGVSPQYQQTDDKGQTFFSFYWNGYNESGPSAWAIQAEENATLKMTSLILSPNQGHENNYKYVIRDTIQMDTLKPIKIRVKVPRNDLDYLRVTVNKNGMDALKQPFNGYLSTSNIQYATGNCCDYKIRQELGRTFLSHEKRTNTPQLDTVLQTKVLANSPFKISCDVFLKGNNNASTKTFNFTQLSAQDSVFVIQF